MSVDNDTVDIRVLSQLPEPYSTLSFDNLPASTTVRALKHHVLQALPSRPQPEVQRLICRGRLLTRDGDTLLDIGLEHLIGDEARVGTSGFARVARAPELVPGLALASIGSVGLSILSGVSLGISVGRDVLLQSSVLV